MKELTIEQKAKAYDEAIKRAKELLEIGVKDTRDKRVVLSFFPELAESENERIRKALISFLKSPFVNENITDEKVTPWIAWLEKQGEQKLTEVEPKFEIGDLITNGILVGRIDEIHELGYHAYFGDHYADVPDIENWHKWTIQDAKDGDVLAVYNIIFIYKRTLASHIVSYCKLFNDIFEHFDDARTCCEGNPYVYPATKVQCDILFKKMKEAGYEWDAEKKELKKIELKSAEWSEDDEKHLSWLIEHLNQSGELYSNLIDWLKSLRPQNTWKPSDKQMEYLAKAITTLGDEGDCKTVSILNDLRFELKKLKGE